MATEIVLRHSLQGAESAGIFDGTFDQDHRGDYGPLHQERYLRGLDIGRACKGLGPAER